MIIARVEVWDDVKCNSGSHLANVAKDEIFAATLQEDLNGRGELALEIDRASGAWSELDERNVLRVIYNDDSVTEHRIIKPREQRSVRGVETAIVVAESIFVDLGMGIVSRTEADGTVTLYYTLLSQTRDQLVDIILASAESYLNKGTVDSSSTVIKTFTFDYDSPLKAIQELAALENMEVAVRRNGDTDYKVDLVDEVGSSATVPEFRFRKNLLGVSREVDASQLANRIYPAGASDGAIRLSAGKARWEVTSVSGLVVYLAGSPVYVDDALNGYYVERANGDTYQITDSEYASQTVTLPSGHTVVQGDLIWLRENGSSKELVYVDDPVSQTTYGVVTAVTEENDVPYVDNLVEDPTLSDWGTGDVLNKWTTVSQGTGSPVITKWDQTGDGEEYTKVGGSSAKIVASNAGEGIKSNQISIDPSDPMVFFSGFIDIYVVSGVVEFFWQHQDEGRFPEEGRDEAAYTSETERWIQLSIEGKRYPEAAKWVELHIVSKDGAATFYVDSVQFTNTSGNYPFFDGRAGNELWSRAQTVLDERSQPKVSYDINVLDLTGIDSTTWPYDAVTLGGDVYIYDDDLGIEATVRCLATTRDLLRGHNTQLTLSNKPDDVIDILTKLRRRSQVGYGPQPAVAGIDQFNGFVDNEGVIVIELMGKGITRSFKYYASYSAIPTVTETMTSGTSSNSVNGEDITLDGDDFKEGDPGTLGPGSRAYVRAVAYSLAGGTGSAGETSVLIIGPPALNQPNITGTDAAQLGDGNDTGGAILKRTWEVDTKTVAVRHFRRMSSDNSSDWYPTADGSSTGGLDYDYDRGLIDEAENFTYQDGGYTTGKYIWDIGVPIDENGRAGDRNTPAEVEITGTTGGGDPGDYAITDAWRYQTAAGTSCTPESSQRAVSVNWTTNLTQDTGFSMQIERRVDGGVWHWVYTENSPYSTTNSTRYCGMWLGAPGLDFMTCDFKLLLYEGTTLHDTVILNEASTVKGNRCTVQE